jgi:hypothetical protein
MIGFEVHVNGKKVCVAGAECVVGVNVDWTWRSPEYIHFAISGISNAGGEDHHVEWDRPDVAVGDEVTIRIVETDSPDSAIRRPRLKRDTG